MKRKKYIQLDYIQKTRIKLNNFVSLCLRGLEMNSSKLQFVSFLFVISLFTFSCSKQNDTIDLRGEWQFAIDSSDVGVAQKLYLN